MRELIFEKPSLAPLPNRIGWGLFTAFFWIVWIYLWMPLITMGMWALGVYAFGEYYMDGKTSREFYELIHTAFHYAIVICLLGGSLLLWARIEFLRFHNVNRRSRPVAVMTEELAQYVNLPVQIMEDLKNARRVTAYHNVYGHLVGGDPGYTQDENELKLA